MKTLIILLGALLCVQFIHAVDITLNNDVGDKELKRALITFRNNEASSSDKSLFNAAVAVLSDLESGDISRQNADKLSLVLIDRYMLFVRDGRQKETYGVMLRLSIITLNERMTKKIERMHVTRSNLAQCLTEVKKMSQDLSFGRMNSIPTPPELLENLDLACNMTQIALNTPDPRLIMGTSDIRMLVRVAPMADDWGYKRAAKAMLAAAAFSSGKLIVSEDKEFNPKER